MKRFAIFACALMFFGCFVGMAYGLDPLDDEDRERDPDRDGLSNWEEYLWASDPNDPDSDGAGAHDGWEVWYETHRAVDSDGRELIDPGYHFSPISAEDEGFVDLTKSLIMVRDADAMDLLNDPDGDGWNNLHEFLVGTDPTNPNTDDDMYTEDSNDPFPLVSDGPKEGPSGGGNGGGGSGIGMGMAVLHA